MIPPRLAAAPGLDDPCRRAWRADRGDARRRLDLSVVRHLAGLPGATRNQVQEWIGAGRVRINGRVAARPALRLAAGDSVEVDLPAPPPEHRPPEPQALPLAVLYEDDDLLVLDKPPGMVVHPTGRHRDGTLINAVAWHLQAAGADRAVPSLVPESESAARPGLVNRLDRDTSGVLLVAKTRAAHAGLARAVAARGLCKEYLAVVYGRAPGVRGRIELPLRRDAADRRRVVAAAAGGEGLAAVTLYEVLAEAGPGTGAAGAAPEVWLSLVVCRLVTGRTHQIRVHLAAIGLPIVGDPLYGEPRHRGIADAALAAPCGAFPRQALHSWRLGLSHPVSRQPLSWVAPLPADLAGLVALAGGGGWEAAVRDRELEPLRREMRPGGAAPRGRREEKTAAGDESAAVGG